MAEKKTRALFEEAGAATEQAPVTPGAANGEKLANRGRIRLWQFILAALVVLIVVVGGMTRLTDSGLSITEWNLVTGVLPPLSTEGWVSEFAKYQKIPEFELNKPTMEEFKVIYWWEWGHRFIGRVIGLVFIIPFVWMLVKKTIPAGWTKRLLIPGILIGIQGIIGWWMVSSGLAGSDRVDVAPYRLAVHLGLAFVIFCLLVWNVFCLGDEEHELLAARRRRFKPQLGFGGLTVMLIFVQVICGAMVAGLDAGRGYTDWPLMQGSFFPPNDTPEAIWQFIHRMVGCNGASRGEVLGFGLFALGVRSGVLGDCHADGRRAGASCDHSPAWRAHLVVGDAAGDVRDCLSERTENCARSCVRSG